MRAVAWGVRVFGAENTTGRAQGVSGSLPRRGRDMPARGRAQRRSREAPHWVTGHTSGIALIVFAVDVFCGSVEHQEYSAGKYANDQTCQRATVFRHGGVPMNFPGR